MSGSKRKSETDLLRLQLADTHFQSDIDAFDAGEPDDLNYYPRKSSRHGRAARSNIEWEDVTAWARRTAAARHVAVDAHEALSRPLSTSKNLDALAMIIGSPPEKNERLSGTGTSMLSAEFKSGVQLLEANHGQSYKDDGRLDAPRRTESKGGGGKHDDDDDDDDDDARRASEEHIDRASSAKEPDEDDAKADFEGGFFELEF